MADKVRKIIILVLGRTGDGKSTVCIKLVRMLGGLNHNFREGNGTDSTHMHAVEKCEASDCIVNDSPGLMDSKGVEQDEKNIKLIVEAVREQGYVTAFFLVVNEQAPRFDGGMQAAVKLFVDSFGPQCLANFGLVFTRAFGTLDEAKEKGAEITRVISERTGVPVAHLPVWQVECHPEKLANSRMKISSEAVAELEAMTNTSLDDMLRWARSKPDVDTSDAKFGVQYAERAARAQAEAKEEAARQNAIRNAAIAAAAREETRRAAERAAIALADAEAARREAKRNAEKIVHESQETKEDTVGQEWRETYRKTRNHWLTERDSVWRNKWILYRISTRTKRIRGNGSEEYTDWQVNRDEWRQTGDQTFHHEY